jgi:hypothetical protein
MLRSAQWEGLRVASQQWHARWSPPRHALVFSIPRSGIAWDAVQHGSESGGLSVTEMTPAPSTAVRRCPLRTILVVGRLPPRAGGRNMILLVRRPPACEHRSAIERCRQASFEPIRAPRAPFGALGSEPYLADKNMTGK